MTVEALIFITLGLLAVGMILRAATSSSAKRKSDIGFKKSISVQLNLSGPLPDRFEANLNGYIESKKKIEALKYVRETTGLGLKDAKDIVDWVFSGKSLHSLLSGNGNGHGLDVDVITKELEVVPGRRDAAPTAELQAIGDIDAVQRAQTLVDKGQIIEAIRYLCDNAGFEMKKAVDMVDSMGKKVYPSD